MTPTITSPKAADWTLVNREGEASEELPEATLPQTAPASDSDTHEKEPGSIAVVSVNISEASHNREPDAPLKDPVWKLFTSCFPCCFSIQKND